ncbi:MAG: NBR1-Ig-like domain-containing protein [Anaerolineales bacterium]
MEFNKTKLQIFSILTLSIIADILILLILTLGIITACSQSPSASDIQSSSSDPSNDSFATITSSSVPDTPSATATQIPSPTPSPTEDVLPSATPTIQDSATPTQPICTNIAEFEKHLSLSDGSILKSNNLYAKVWLVKNIGTCTWTTDYKLVFINGDENLNQTDISLPEEVPPGDSVELKINFATPEEGNTYIANWMLASETGMIFGVGPLADQPLVLNFVIKPKSGLPDSC